MRSAIASIAAAMRGSSARTASAELAEILKPAAEGDTGLAADRAAHRARLAASLADPLAARVAKPSRGISTALRHGAIGLFVQDDEAALRLGRYFGVEPQLWMNLQSQYDLEVAEASLGDSLVAGIVPLRDAA